ncbi:hypothetical protein [Pararobbsia silviterrae]|uniref:Uncharacterized protein n=1 Tax=Pararobbsia silviterrae TaxID=1792498 RepID=A0A494X9F9_9BURK|nr:hypothetical protein [Pararobbsia silviterrae]RKP44739.1 hypothetical protein D7S86_27340 [Pararobbsia silviterrae]
METQGTKLVEIRRASHEIRRAALTAVAKRTGNTIECMESCIQAGHKRYAAEFAENVATLTESFLAHQEAGRIKLITPLTYC